MQVTVGQDQLQILRLQGVTIEPVKDPSGWDFLYSRITLDFWFEWHPFATASSAANPVQGPPPWDPVGESLFQLRERLQRDRQLFVMTIGNTLVFRSPSLDQNGKLLACDVGGGPLYELLSFSGLEGDYGALGRLRVTIHKKRNNDILLSNRWTCRTATNEAGMDQRIIEGWAIMRPDAIDPTVAGTQLVNVDVFRNWLFVPCPSGFRRDRADVQITELGDKARYVVVDTADPNPMGNGGGGIQAAYFDGESTAGSTSPIKQWKDDIAWILGGPAHSLQAAMLSVLPDTMARATVRVVGHKDVPKANLLRLALQIALDRGVTNNQIPEIVGCFATQGIGRSEEKGRWVKVELMYRTDLQALAGQQFDFGKIANEQNYNNNITPRNADGTAGAFTFPGDTPLFLPAGPQYQNFNLPHGVRQGDSSGSRGSYVGALMVAALQQPLDLTTLSQPVRTPPAERNVFNAANIA